MEGRKSSKKTKSYGGASRSSRTSQNPPSPSSAARPQYKERVRSAPFGVPQIEEQQWQRVLQQTSVDKTRRGSETSDLGSRLSGSLSASILNESAVHVQPYGSNSLVKTSKNQSK